VVTDKLLEAINKVQDEKLKDLLLTYRSINSPALLFEIFEYLNVKIVQEKLGAIITNIEVDETQDGYSVYLGSVIIDGEPYTLELSIFNNGNVYIMMFRNEDLLLYKQVVEREKNA